jgi:hypothetical protein
VVVGPVVVTSRVTVVVVVTGGAGSVTTQLVKANGVSAKR